MNFFIADDDIAIRSMLAEIIEDHDLGKVVGEADNGSLLSSGMLKSKDVDILFIDMLMPVRDGLETIREINHSFSGKIVMLSQVEDKAMIGAAYSLGVEYYIVKPINLLEVVSVIKRVTAHLRLEKSVSRIQETLQYLDSGNTVASYTAASGNHNIVHAGQYILAELGMIGESGSQDLLEFLSLLMERKTDQDFPPLKDILYAAAQRKLNASISGQEIQKEMKAIEQRVRRAIFQGLNHIASLGLTDYTNPKFEEYSSKFFDFTEVRKIMRTLEDELKPSISDVHINSKKFIKVLFLEAKKNI